MLNMKKVLTKLLNFVAKFTFTTNVTGIYFGYNSSSDFPYIRWIVGDTLYQLQVQTAGLRYLKRVGSGEWTTIWSGH